MGLAVYDAIGFSWTNKKEKQCVPLTSLWTVWSLAPNLYSVYKSSHSGVSVFIVADTDRFKHVSAEAEEQAATADDPWFGGNQSNAKPCNEMRVRRSGTGSPENRKAPVTNLLIRLWQLHRSRTACCVSIHSRPPPSSGRQWCSFIRLIIIRRVITTVVVLMGCLSSHHRHSLLLSSASHPQYLDWCPIRQWLNIIVTAAWSVNIPWQSNLINYVSLSLCVACHHVRIDVGGCCCCRYLCPTYGTTHRTTTPVHVHIGFSCHFIMYSNHAS